jgi:hypothetical protein
MPRLMKMLELLGELKRLNGDREVNELVPAAGSSLVTQSR